MCVVSRPAVLAPEEISWCAVCLCDAVVKQTYQSEILLTFGIFFRLDRQKLCRISFSRNHSKVVDGNVEGN